ncbi:hypothetical protein ACFWFS_27555 [Streptomyces albidoflavus]
MTTTPRTARHLLRDREASLILGAVLVSGFGSSATALVAGVNGASLYAAVDTGLGRAPSWAGVRRASCTRCGAPGRSRRASPPGR